MRALNKERYAMATKETMEAVVERDRQARAAFMERRERYLKDMRCGAIASRQKDLWQAIVNAEKEMMADGRRILQNVSPEMREYMVRELHSAG